MPDGKDAPVKHPMTNQIQYFKKTIFPAVFKHKFAWPFHTPVDPVRLGLPDYFDVIKEPMDMSLIKKKLDNFQVKQHAISLLYWKEIWLKPLILVQIIKRNLSWLRAYVPELLHL